MKNIIVFLDVLLGLYSGSKNFLLGSYLFVIIFISARHGEQRLHSRRGNGETGTLEGRSGGAGNCGVDAQALGGARNIPGWK